MRPPLPSPGPGAQPAAGRGPSTPPQPIASPSPRCVGAPLPSSRRRPGCACAAADVRGFGRPADALAPAASPLHLPPPPETTASAVRAGYGPTPLAFLGDAVWELYARARYFAPPKRLTAYYDAVTGCVRAEAQAAAVEQLTAGPFLTDAERDILRWGRNAKVKAIPKRLTGGGAATAGLYRSATALEVLVGWLYVTDPARLQSVMAYLGMGLDGGGERGGGGLGGSVVAALAAREGGGAGSGGS